MSLWRPVDRGPERDHGVLNATCHFGCW